MDGAGWHKLDKLIFPGNIRIIIQPPHSPELNPIERLWQHIKDHTIKNRIYKTLPELENKVCKFIRTLNPEIIRSICRGSERIVIDRGTGEYAGKAPLGYLNVRDENDKSNIIIDESRSYLIQKMFEIYSTGSVSLDDLEKFAINHNLTNNFFKGREEKPITKNVISNILRNPFYCGSIYVKKYNKFYPHKSSY